MDLTQIAATVSHVEAGEFLEDHPYRVLQLDADGVVYNVCHPEITLEKNFQQVIKYIEFLRQCAGAKWVLCYTTLALKGGREQMAYYKKYQKQRHTHRTPQMGQRVKELRWMLHNYQSDTVHPRPQYYLEADEAIGAAHLAYIQQTNDPRASVICTGDKDLDMYPGIVMDLRTRKFTYLGDYVPQTDEAGNVVGAGTWYNTFGHVKYGYKDGRKTKKMYGRGTAFFWGQMLAGDTADTIAGLPQLNGFLVDRYRPLKRKTSGRRPDAACGDSDAALIISSCRNDKSAYRAVSEAYQAYFKADWRFFFFENAFLLWMRRSDNIMEVKYYLEQFGFDYELHPQQQQALKQYAAECQNIAMYGIQQVKE